MTKPHPKRSFTFVLGSLFAFCCSVHSLTAANSSEESTNKSIRPNIILFIADDMAWNDAEPYGHPHIQTPNLTRLAKGGLTFDNAFLTTSSCSPTRCSLITGQYPHNTGAPNLHEPLPADQLTFVEELKKSGYFTAASGKWHLGPHAKKAFNKINHKLGHWKTYLKERPQDAPFFFWIATTDPHRPYAKDTIPKPHTPNEAVVPPFLIDDQETRADLAAYYDEIGRLDTEVGDILDQLEAQNLSNNTLFVFISDNGRPFPRCKTTMYDSGIKTPMFCYWPNHIPANQRSNALVSTIDLVPTFLKLAHLSPKPSFQGYAFHHLFEKPTAKHRDYIFAERNWHDFDFWGRAVRSPRFKYIENNYPQNADTPPADAVRSPSFQTMVKAHKLGTLNKHQTYAFTAPRAPEELYDVHNDPFELKNLAQDPEYRNELNQMRARLAQWKRETEDPSTRERIPDKFHPRTGERLKQK